MILIDGVEILTVLDDCGWSGGRDLGTRSFTFSILYNPLKPDIKQYNFAVGSKVEWIDGDKTLFYGTIQELSYNTDDDVISFNCVDFMNRFIRSKFLGRFTGTLTDIANNICGLFGLENGIETTSTQKHNIVSTGDITYYEVLTTACESVFGKDFTLYMDGKTLKLAETESIMTLEIGKNIRASNISQSISNMVTKVLIIDNNGKTMQTVQDDDALRDFGLFQEIYNYNKDVKDNYGEAKKLLVTVENEINLTANNDNRCISGRYINIIEPVNKLEGLFRIETDNHTIGVDSSMSLEVKEIKNDKNR